MCGVWECWQIVERVRRWTVVKQLYGGWNGQVCWRRWRGDVGGGEVEGGS